MANLIESKIADKLEAENVGFFSGRFEMYSEAIRKKVNNVHMSKDAGNQPLFPTAGTFLPFAFIDGNCTGTCTPGQGLPVLAPMLLGVQMRTASKRPSTTAGSTSMASST